MLLGDCIRTARRAHGWSQVELGTLVGLSANAIHKIEVGVTPDPGFAHVRRLAAALHLSLDAMHADLAYPAPRANGRRAVPA